ncbi:MAG: DNA adenine methylase [Acholeplasmatales bacterium]|nr:DNA adenine methylase [Acholeplasmatales bacterium]
MSERKEFLTEQIITYLGNKRSLLTFIDNAIKVVLKEIGSKKINTFDVFAGSGIVSRYLKQYSNILYTNDLEDYSYTINKCYLSNEDEIDLDTLRKWYDFVINKINNSPLINNGFISKLYAPDDDLNIKEGERVFYTTRNAKYLDSARQYLEEVPEPYKTLLLGPLLYEASTKNNTSGVFKGFYKNSKTHIGQYGGDGKNALQRILANIELKMPVLSNNHCEVHVLQGNSNEVCKIVPHVDLAYLDPPYNQHPYGSNYFMLNLINNYKEPTIISKVSGIPTGWNKSDYNKKNKALESMKDLCQKLNATYILISYNSEGFITFDEMVSMLEELGNVRAFDKKYNVFRGCRNLRNRDIHVKEYLFLLVKEKD